MFREALMTFIIAIGFIAIIFYANNLGYMPVDHKVTIGTGECSVTVRESTVDELMEVGMGRWLRACQQEGAE